MNIQLYNNDCLIKLKELEENSIDSIVTDPPYEISFMSKGWDGTGIAFNQEVWKECLRVLKPGGHILAFGATRTYHRMTVAIEDAGFEIRDCLFWCYGSGFPKSHNIALAIDKLEGKTGHRGKAINLAGKGDRLDIETSVSKKNGTLKEAYKSDNKYNGFGTALKPAVEPVVMGRKPFKGNVAGNVLEWGTGGLNIDACRIGTDDNFGGGKKATKIFNGDAGYNGEGWEAGSPLGRWPANLILDEEAGRMLDEQSGISKSTKRSAKNNKRTEHTNTYTPPQAMYSEDNTYGDTGGASRFFYCPKVSKKERNEGLDVVEQKNNRPLGVAFTKDDSLFDQKVNNYHPTVKPVALLSYLIRLVTPKGGTVLDPFMGSGSTGKAAIREGMGFVGIEKEEEYFQIAQSRIEHEAGQHKYREFF